MTSSIYVRKSTVLIVVIFTSIILVGTSVSFIVWFSYDKSYGFGEIVILKDQDFVNKYDFPGSGTINDPYLIADLNIDTNKEIAIFVEETTKHFLITNCTIKCPLSGISINYVAEGTVRIENNEIQTTADSNIIEDLIFVFWAPGSRIINNQLSHLSNNYYTRGIFVSSSKNSLIANNSCNSLGEGIYVASSEAALIEYNYIENCENGVYIYQSDNSIARYNSLHYNDIFGIANSISIGCVFHHNNFFNNSFATPYYSQAGDGMPNIWYDTSTNEGNYWNNLIWDDDVTYLISGSGSNTDFYPLQFPVVI